MDLNILLFLTPKKDVACLFDYFTIRQALEKMEYHRYSSMPIITEDGDYVGTLTEGDLLYYIKNECDLNFEEAEDTALSKVRRYRDCEAIRVDASLSDVFEKAMNQNFIPVLDDRGKFIGIITRKKILTYFKRKIDALEN